MGYIFFWENFIINFILVMIWKLKLRKWSSWSLVLSWGHKNYFMFFFTRKKWNSGFVFPSFSTHVSPHKIYYAWCISSPNNQSSPVKALVIWLLFILYLTNLLHSTRWLQPPCIAPSNSCHSVVPDLRASSHCTFFIVVWIFYHW